MTIQATQKFSDPMNSHPQKNLLLSDPEALSSDLSRRLVAIKDLSFSLTPRKGKENLEHIRRLAGIDEGVDPIVVHLDTMSVIDGSHRVRAAQMRGEAEIEACFFSGSIEDAFVLAVQSNIGHGLPLTLNERKASAARIVVSHPHWSDRVVAKKTGLNAKTVGRIRRESTKDELVSGVRVGADGKARPLSSIEGRRSAAALFEANPESSLREVSRKSGLSVATVRDVRERVIQGQDPLPERLRRTDADSCPTDSAPGAPTTRSQARSGPAADRAAVVTAEAVRKLVRDPSLRATESGRALLRVLMVTEVDSGQWDQILRTIPEHCIPLVRDVFIQRSKELRELARMIPADKLDRP
ncbi:hypothetical protein GCM10007079_02040 [Nocardiopsis terrae]|uniref:ParB-like chromosome segregation protein Spo0J n=1 Tax=Nocardiopsis terrae TaxID=372655 RepID=A0ABR9HMP7_9ACTN|nr:ParB N-terminal domain-containing protein [Nocardiopsis terrae]MBE1460256.1 ParB-like chromosome segregation protein Spo0J [Nocardiopsis terrae]GHC70505.1 hypothetical protein GCM10007079_02040 [Nocardiopsis terrae]